MAKSKNTYLASVDGGGYLNVRCMLKVRERDGLKYFWFSTNTSSKKVEQYKANPKACIYVCDNMFFKGAIMLGAMEVLEDTEAKERIWRKGDTMYCPRGVTDPDYCVLKFTAQKCRFYGFECVEGKPEFEIE